MEKTNCSMKYEYNKPFIIKRADPFVTKAIDGTYFFTASVPEYDRIILRHSHNIADLQNAKENVIWVKHKEGAQSIHVWAPELHYLFDGWYIYYSAGDKDNIWKIRPYVLKCMGNNPIKGPWVELGAMKAAPDDKFSFKSFSLDATVFNWGGINYYFWAEKTSVGKKISNIYIAKMKSANELETAQVLLTTPDYSWERQGFWVNEGPAVIEHDGRIFLTYSASETGSSYCMGMLSINEKNNILDPREWKKEKFPILATDKKAGIFGPGHNTFVKSENDKYYLCFYHARMYENIKGNPLYDPNRNTYVMKVEWNSKGQPIFRYKNNIIQSN